MQYKTQEQADRVYDIKAKCLVIYEEDYFDDTKYFVELLALADYGDKEKDFYRKFIVKEDGHYEVIDYMPVKEESGDESFDVVVEREIEKEEKEMSRVDLDSIANDAMLEAFENYVRDHQDELRRYAEETTREKVLDYVGNYLDLEDGAHSVIDDLINYHLEYDAQPDVQAQEDIINQYIFE